MPTVRSSVLLPDMLEPLTTSRRGCRRRRTSLRTHARRRQERVAELGAIEQTAALLAGRRSPETDRADARIDRPRARKAPRTPPTAPSQRGCDGHARARHASIAQARCVPQRKGSEMIRKIRLCCQSCNSTSRCSARMADEARPSPVSSAPRSATSRGDENCSRSSCSSRCRGCRGRERPLPARCSARSTRFCCGQAKPIWMASTICQRRLAAAGQPEHAAVTTTDDRQCDRDPSRPEGRQQRRRFRPADELVAMHRRRDVGPGQRQRLAQIERAEQARRRPAAVRRSRPARLAMSASRELRFAGARPGDRQQLEERSAAEQVEVVRVEVVVVAKAIAGRAGARPAVLDSGQASLVERNCPRGLVALADHAARACAGER